jgi:hypothetical protein
MRRARLRGIAVVFHLHNFGQSEPKGSDSKNDRRAFADVSAVIFPSESSRCHHARLLGLDGPVIPYPIPLDRIVAADPEPKYVTFINPQPSKGMAVFARIAVELSERRPDIPFLVVEGRGTSDALAPLGGCGGGGATPRECRGSWPWGMLPQPPDAFSCP